jgi:hypothetical protein
MANVRGIVPLEVSRHWECGGVRRVDCWDVGGICILHLHVRDVLWVFVVDCLLAWLFYFSVSPFVSYLCCCVVRLLGKLVGLQEELIYSTYHTKLGK